MRHLSGTVLIALAGCSCLLLLAGVHQNQQAAPQFEAIQPDLFAVSGGQPNCWADFDNDGDLDLFVGMKGNAPNKLYRNDNGTFKEVAAEVGIADTIDTRAAAWGDFDGDGNFDLYVGFSKRSGATNKLYHGDGGGKHFTEVGHKMGVDVSGFETRQVVWVDYDNDGRVDLFVAFRDGPNMLFHNEGDHFRNVAKEMGVDDPRRTVAAIPAISPPIASSPANERGHERSAGDLPGL